MQGQQVAGAAGEQTEDGTRPYPTRSDGADRTVTAERAHHRRPVLDRLLSLTGARVVLGRLVPRRRRPAVALAARGDARLTSVRSSNFVG